MIQIRVMKQQMNQIHKTLEQNLIFLTMAMKEDLLIIRLVHYLTE